MSYESEDEDMLTDESAETNGKNTETMNSVSTDAEMRALLESWKAPDAPRSLDLRVLKAYRTQIPGRSLRRVFASSIRVPFPIAATVVLLLLASALVSLRSARPLTPQMISESPQVKIVEVPVIQEKTVTRTVYVEKGRDPRSNLNRRTHGQQVAVVPRNESERNADRSGEYFTHADLSGFQPLPQMTIEVIRRTKTDEN